MINILFNLALCILILGSFSSLIIFSYKFGHDLTYRPLGDERWAQAIQSAELHILAYGLELDKQAYHDLVAYYYRSGQPRTPLFRRKV